MSSGEVKHTSGCAMWVERSNTQSEAWHGVAISISILLILGGIFGTLGLLHSQFNILPSGWISRFIEVIESASCSWSFWILSLGGLIGISLIVHASCRIHQIRMAELALSRNLGPLGPSEASRANSFQNPYKAKNPDALQRRVLQKKPVQAEELNSYDQVDTKPLIIPEEIIRPTYTLDIPDLYGPQAWQIWDVEVLDVVPEEPQVDLSRGDMALLYIPQNIRFNGVERDVTLQTLVEITGIPLNYSQCPSIKPYIEQQFGYKATPGWVLIDKNVIGRGLGCKKHKELVEKRGCSMPNLFDAALLNLMIFAFTGKYLYGQDPPTCTRCSGLGEASLVYRNQTYVSAGFYTIGHFGPDGLTIDEGNSYSKMHGVACTKRNL